MEIIVRNLIKKKGKFYKLYDITTKSGLVVSILPLGAAIQKIAFPGRDGQSTVLSLGFPEAKPYEDRICYAGATLGPNAGRIKNASLPVPGACCQLSRNDQENQLHGGFHNLSACLWKTESVQCDGKQASVLLSTAQPDGLDGYPGNRRYQVRYMVTEDQRITIDYTAWTDKPTYINLSNHTYWNLSGDFTRSAEGQELTICSSQVCLNRENHLPTGLVSVSGTAFDFSAPRTIREAKNLAKDPDSLRQLAIGKGYNHAYLLNPDSEAPACCLRDIASGRTLRLLTDAPAVVLYSGGYLPKGLPLINGQYSVPSCAIALEAQELPDMVHLFPSSCRYTFPGKPFRRRIEYWII